MTMFDCDEYFHNETMDQLRDFRADGSLCDVTLSVGQDEIRAHRCVLAARSQYFRTLFLGQFKEASMKNINMSEVVNNVKDLEQVVNFIYSGDIEINEDNLDVLVTLSTYLMIEPLKENCMYYMQEHGSLRNCLNHYLCSIEHGLDTVEKEEKLLVASRFHDFFIHEDNLDLNPAEFQLLLKNDMFQHCTIISMLQFLLKWLTKDATDERISVASEILEKLNKETTDGLSDQQKSEIKELLMNIEKKLHSINNCEVKICLEKLTHLTKRNCCREKRASRSASIDRPTSDHEEVIVTLSPKQCVVDEFEQTIYSKKKAQKTFTEPTFTLSCYRPSSKTWHLIKDLENEEIVADL